VNPVSCDQNISSIPVTDIICDLWQVTLLQLPSLLNETLISDPLYFRVYAGVVERTHTCNQM
jgi:hypothetical protein